MRLSKQGYIKLMNKLKTDPVYYMVILHDLVTDKDVLTVEEDTKNNVKIIKVFSSAREAQQYAEQVIYELAEEGDESVESLEYVIHKVNYFKLNGALSKIYTPNTVNEDGLPVRCVWATIDEDGRMVQLDVLWQQLQH